MRRKLLKDSSKIMLVLLLITILVMISEKPVYAHLSSIQPSSGCFSQIVTLNGKMPATSRCVVKKPLLTKGGGQLAVLSSNILIQQHCGEYVINALILFRDSNFSGDSICFKEHGTAQLSDWRMSDGTSWNDQVSSYVSVLWVGYFYTDDQQSGYRWDFNWRADQESYTAICIRDMAHSVLNCILNKSISSIYIMSSNHWSNAINEQDAMKPESGYCAGDV